MKINKLLALYILLFITKLAYGANLNAWTGYADSLQNCTSGTFTVPNPVNESASITYQIIGMKGDSCQIIMKATFAVPGEAPQSAVFDCTYPSNLLPEMAKEVREMASGNLSASSNNVFGQQNTYCKQHS